MWHDKKYSQHETVQTIIVNDKISLCSSAGTSDCERSTCCDDKHGHIITEAWRLIINSKLSGLLSNGSSYMEPNIISYSKCKNGIDYSIDDRRENLKLSTSLETMI